jgi:hypothetical protein
MSEPKIDEAKPSETKPKKMVSRSVAIALGIVCVLLIAGLGGTIAYYTMTINNKDSTYNDYVSSHSHTDFDYNSLSTQNTNLQNQNTNLQNQVNDLTSTLNLGKSTVWVNDETVSQGADTYTYWTFSANYAGYVGITLSSSTSSSTHANVVYSALGNRVSFDHDTPIGPGGTAYFPVLPSSNITCEVGNGNLIGGATETVTIIYYY